LSLNLLPQEFRQTSLYCLGVPLSDLSDLSDASWACPACGKPSGYFGDHAISYAAEGSRIGRHDRLRDHLYSIAMGACLSPQKEARGLLSSSLSKPGDIFLPNWKGRRTALDVTVTSPLCKSYVRKASTTTGAALDIRCQTKRRVHDAQCRQQGIFFIPLAVETLGGWETEAASTIRAMALQLASRTCTPNSIVVNQTFQRLGVLLQRGNAALLALHGPPQRPSHITGAF
jgi:hypothetical protein